MKKTLALKLKEINSTMKKEGFIIEGFFGSHAREENKVDSDLDLLYRLDEKFYKKNTGFLAFQKLNEIKQIISKKVNKKIDLAPLNNLSQTGKKYILSEVIYV